MTKWSSLILTGFLSSYLASQSTSLPGRIDNPNIYYKTCCELFLFEYSVGGTKYFRFLHEKPVFKASYMGELDSGTIVKWSSIEMVYFGQTGAIDLAFFELTYNGKLIKVVGSDLLLKKWKTNPQFIVPISRTTKTSN